MARDQQEAMEQEQEAKRGTAGHHIALNTLFLATEQPLAKQDLGFSSLWSVQQDRDLERVHHPSQAESVFLC